MTHGSVPVQAQLPIALVVATGHEAQIVDRALRATNVTDRFRLRFEVVQVGVGCAELDSKRLVETCGAIVSTGFAGALAPHIRSGTLLLPEKIKNTHNTVYGVDTDVQQMIGKNAQTDIAPSAIVKGPLLHTDKLLATVSQKQHAYENSRCIACDMESATLAAVAEQGGLPFACLRIVLDPAHMIIPDPIVQLAELEREPTATEFLTAVSRHPAQLAATAAFLWHTFKASRALSRSVKMLAEGCSK